MCRTVLRVLLKKVRYCLTYVQDSLFVSTFLPFSPHRTLLEGVCLQFPAGNVSFKLQAIQFHCRCLKANKDAGHCRVKVTARESLMQTENKTSHTPDAS